MGKERSEQRHIPERPQNRARSRRRVSTRHQHDHRDGRPGRLFVEGHDQVAHSLAQQYVVRQQHGPDALGGFSSRTWLVLFKPYNADPPAGEAYKSKLHLFESEPGKELAFRIHWMGVRSFVTPLGGLCLVAMTLYLGFPGVQFSGNARQDMAEIHKRLAQVDAVAVKAKLANAFLVRAAPFLTTEIAFLTFPRYSKYRRRTTESAR